MSPPSANLRVEQAGKVCDALGSGGMLRAELLNVEILQWARRFARFSKAYIEFDRLVVLERKVRANEQEPPKRKRRQK